jgi:C1A family cysteine protease
MSKQRKKSPQARFGWLPDRPDVRDYRYKVEAPQLAALPPRVDLRQGCSPVEDQGELGSCTAHALVGALEFLEKKAGDATPTNLSRLFLYYQERLVEGTVDSDSGAFLRDGIKVLNRIGTPAESAWPYRIEKFTRRPTVTASRKAGAHRITLYERIDTLAQMRACLADGYPFVFGFTVYESFESEAVARTGAVNMPSGAEEELGGHAVLAVGYDDATGRVLVRNSWGVDWGDGGYFTLPYDYVQSRDLSDDLWRVTR